MERSDSHIFHISRFRPTPTFHTRSQKVKMSALLRFDPPIVGLQSQASNEVEKLKFLFHH
jgi:hypothetical protein